MDIVHHLSPPPPECLLVEEILVAAVPDVIIIQHRGFYLVKGGKGKRVIFRIALNKDRSAEENMMQIHPRVNVEETARDSRELLCAAVFAALAYSRGANVLNHTWW